MNAIIPKHYGGPDAIYEVLKVLEAWLTPEQMIGFLRGNSIKYQARAGKKGDVSEDLKKAEFYTNYEVGFRKRLADGNIGEDRAMQITAKKILGKDALPDGLRWDGTSAI